jgi:histidyl-tRNA synthetase
MSSGPAIQTLPGFRDFYPQECATRNYLFSQWRDLCHRYGFHEYEGPILESTDLYRKKSGDEVVEQLFAFTDKGDREVSMRPELTPTLARMVAARQREFKKPMRWFSIGPFFRFERPQIAKGRLREFYQFNCDIIGEDSENVDAEILSLSIDLMLSLGFDQDDFVVRVSDRQAWIDFAEEAKVSDTETFLQVIDKMEREKKAKTEEKLSKLGTSLESVKAFMAEGVAKVPRLARLFETLKAQGKDGFCKVDLGIVRGLAYYTGVVFEIFDKKHGLRAIAGGGRYDKLIHTLSDGKANMPAAGFAMGDAVIGNLLEKTDEAKRRLTLFAEKTAAIDVYAVIASEQQRYAALDGIQQLRDAGLRVHFSYTPAGVGKQIKLAEQQNARAAVIFGDEYPQINVKDLQKRQESTVDGIESMVETTKALLENPHPGDLLA